MKLTINSPSSWGFSVNSSLVVSSLRRYRAIHSTSCFYVLVRPNWYSQVGELCQLIENAAGQTCYLIVTQVPLPEKKKDKTMVRFRSVVTGGKSACPNLSTEMQELETCELARLSSFPLFLLRLMTQRFFFSA